MVVSDSQLCSLPYCSWPVKYSLIQDKSVALTCISMSLLPSQPCLLFKALESQCVPKAKKVNSKCHWSTLKQHKPLKRLWYVVTLLTMLRGSCHLYKQEWLFFKLNIVTLLFSISVFSELKWTWFPFFSIFINRSRLVITSLTDWSQPNHGLSDQDYYPESLNGY